MTDMIYTNRRGEMVVPLHIFSELNHESIVKALKKPYPPHRQIADRRQRKSRKLHQ